MAAIDDRNHGGDHFMLMAPERQIRRHERAKRAESMEEHVGEKRVAGDDAGRLTAAHGMDGSGVFDGIQLPLGFDGVFDAGVFFHWNGFDPGHEESSLSWDGDGREGSGSAARP